MEYITEPALQCDYCLQFHATVRMKNSIVVVSTCDKDITPHIWTYNLWTEQWRKCHIFEGKELPATGAMFGLKIKSAMYVLSDGCNNLWKFMLLTEGVFQQSIVHNGNPTKLPSPRRGPCIWEYGDKIWIYGGFGKSPVGFINDHGAFEMSRRSQERGFNNQLFSFDPSTEIWRNIECFGDVPSPRSNASSAVIIDKIWLYGGMSASSQKYDLYESNMHSFTWTQIDTDIVKPKLFFPLLTATKMNQLVLHGRHTQATSMAWSTWILDTGSRKWTKFPVSAECDFSCHHTSTTGLNNDVINICGHSRKCKCENLISRVMLGPRSLQQLAMRIIHEYRTCLPWWESLPPSLKCKLLGKLIK